MPSTEHPPTPGRILADSPVTDLASYSAAGGGEAIRLARRVGPEAIISAVEDAGLRGRGGAGFPTAKKWRTVVDNRSPTMPSTVVVNAAEGEPATFKDRTLLRRDPYGVLEGALIAAVAIGADTVVVATKEKFTRSAERVSQAIAEIRDADWAPGIDVQIVTGPDRYLFGEETALLEVVDGRPPLPRLAPPYRAGPESPAAPAAGAMAGPTPATEASPSLVNNAETLANVPGILRDGPERFRTLGTADTPGTILVTVTGATARHGVAEVPTDTTLREAIDLIGGGARPGRTVRGAMSGVANPAVFGEALDTALSHDAMHAIGSGLGAAGFTVFDDETDLVSVAHGVSRFLAVESCGQCEPCKSDGVAIAASLDELRRSRGSRADLVVVDEKLHTVADGARCYLAHQHELAVRSLLDAGGEIFDLHATRAVPGATETVIAPVLDIVGTTAELDVGHLDVGPDWTSDGDSGRVPAAAIDVAARTTDR